MDKLVRRIAIALEEHVKISREIARINIGVFELNQKTLRVAEESLDLNRRLLELHASNNVVTQEGERNGNVEVITRVYGE